MVPITVVALSEAWNILTPISSCYYNSFLKGAEILRFPTMSRQAECPVMKLRGTLSLRVKLPEREAHNWTSCAPVKNAWTCICISPYVFMEWCLRKHEDNVKFWLVPHLERLIYSLCLITHCQITWDISLISLYCTHRLRLPDTAVKHLTANRDVFSAYYCLQYTYKSLLTAMQHLFRLPAVLIKITASQQRLEASKSSTQVQYTPKVKATFNPLGILRDF